MLIGGSVIIENVFSWPGIGSYAMTSVLYHDYPVIQGYAVVMVGLVIIINLLIDLLYAFADPKLRTNVLQRRGRFEKTRKKNPPAV
jgi:peptide/nickel transport system permease protein